MLLSSITLNVTLITVLIIVIALAAFVAIYLVCVKKCPSDKIMVIRGGLLKNADGEKVSYKCIHGGVAFVLPFIQMYSFLDLTPISLIVDLKNALCRNIRIDFTSRFTVGISTEKGIMQKAAECLSGLNPIDIQELAKDIILGQLRLTIAIMDIEEINANRDKFLEAIARNVENELKKIGLRLINENILDLVSSSETDNKKEN